MMVEIFNGFDRQTRTRFMTALEDSNRESAERIKNMMFTLDDLVKFDNGSAQTLMRNIDKNKLAVALKRANETVRAFFCRTCRRAQPRCCSTICRRSAGAPARCRRGVGPAGQPRQGLAAKSEIMIAKNRADEELVY